MTSFNAPAKKQLGQHFLHDRNIIARIIQAVDPKPGDHLVEIGPGQGAITFPLLECGRKLTVIEFDRDLITPLSKAAMGIGELTIIHKDVLQVDFGKLGSANELEGPIRLVGNLPYNISSPILFHVLDHAEVVRDMHFMLQKEVVDRMASEPGSKVYGRLSVMLQAYCRVTPLFDVPPSAFKPPPKVDSAVVRLIPIPTEQIAVKDRTMFADVVRDAFGQRRKTLRNALSKLCGGGDLEACGINPGERAEKLPVADFVRLANHLSAKSGAGV